MLRITWKNTTLCGIVADGELYLVICVSNCQEPGVGSQISRRCRIIIQLETENPRNTLFLSNKDSISA